MLHDLNWKFHELAKSARNYRKPSNTHDWTKESAGRTPQICCDHIPLWMKSFFLPSPQPPDLWKHHGPGRKFIQQSTFNSSLSLLVMQGVGWKTLWCQSTAFNWLESERAFYNPDLGSSCILCLIFWCPLILVATCWPFPLIVITWTIWEVKGQRSCFD